MKISRLSLAAGIMVLVIMMCLMMIVVPGCQKEVKPTGTVVLYTSVPTGVINKVKAEFEKRQPGVELDISRSCAGPMIEKIHKEIEAGGIKADVVWVGELTVGEELKQAGQLLRYESPEAGKIIPILKDKDGYYCAARLVNMIITYNTDKVKEKPTGYRDLLKPEYKGKVALADPNSACAVLYTVATLAQSEEFGWDYFGRLYENEMQIVKCFADFDKAVADGELWMGIAPDFRVRAQKTKDPSLPIDYVFPEAGAVLVPTPIAIPKDSQNIVGAKAFVDFILSKEGQQLMSAQGQAPVRLDVIPPLGIPTITQMKIIPSNPAEILRLKEDTKRICAELFQGKQVEDDHR